MRDGSLYVFMIQYGFSRFGRGPFSCCPRSGDASKFSGLSSPDVADISGRHAWKQSGQYPKRIFAGRSRETQYRPQQIKILTEIPLRRRHNATGHGEARRDARSPSPERLPTVPRPEACKNIAVLSQKHTLFEKLFANLR